MSDSILVRVNHIRGQTPGKVIEVKVCPDGVPLDYVWRRRLKDAETDGCCVVVRATPDSDRIAEIIERAELEQ